MIADFWKSIWPLGILVLLSLGGTNVYYLINHRLLTLLEKEDWTALASLLEKKIYQDGRYSSRNIRLLAQAYLVKGELDAVLQLETKTAAAKPAQVAANALIFGVTRILAKTGATAEFFQPFADMKFADIDWVRWYYGYSLALEKSFEKSKTTFTELAKGARDRLTAGLAAYFLCEVLGKNLPSDNDIFLYAAAGKERAFKYFRTSGAWRKKTEKIKNLIHGVIIKKYFDAAGAWIFEESKN
jgi:hypothetical protein